MAVGGSIQEINVAGRSFPVAADADATLHLGGWVNTVERNGDGSSRVVQQRSSWSLSGVVVAIDHLRGDAQWLAGERGGLLDLILPAAKPQFQESRNFVPVAITLADGTVYEGIGVVVGKTEASTMNSTMAVDFEGDGALVPQ